MRKREFVRRSFSSIARNYDLLNTLLSFGVDKWWRRETVKASGRSPPGLVLDACAGTMRLGEESLCRWDRVRVVAVDFSLAMLGRGVQRMKNPLLTPVCGDVEGLPFRDETFDRAMVGFGIRNLADPQRGIEELFRVLKMGGRLLILEFGRPTQPVFKDLYRWYLSRFVPWLGGIISHQKEIYRYLDHSIMTFCEREELASMMKQAGFSDIRSRKLTWGIADLYIAEKAP